MNEERLSLKNILFTKALPNITIPFSTTGYKIFPCTDCGDKFVFQSSYDDHVSRKSFKITYMCRHCGETKIFFNRCNLLAHIRLHSFKTATINITDLHIEPLPLSPSIENIIPIAPIETNISKAPIEKNISNTSTEKSFSKDPVEKNISKTSIEKSISKAPIEKNISKASVEKICNKQKVKYLCFECKTDITCTGSLYTDRAKHYMQYSNHNMICYTCPVCLYSLPTTCALLAHLRIHLKQLPIICPECGLYLDKNTVNYPFSHDCDGFNMIRATTRFKCFDNKCELFHPSKYREHMTNHVRKVYKCPICSFKWLDKPPGAKHTLCNNSNVNIVCYFKCPLCANKLLTKGQIGRHLSSHFDNSAGNEFQVYPCGSCGDIYRDAKLLIHHKVKKHDTYKGILRNVLKTTPEKSNGIYKVIKRCEKCQRSFTYRCKFADIKKLPNECPYNCSHTPTTNEIQEHSVVCFICKSKIKSDWTDIKKHFAELHNSIKCIDVKIELKKMDFSELMQKKKKKIKLSGKIRKNVKGNKSNTICETLKTSDSIDKTCDMITDLNTNNDICDTEMVTDINTNNETCTTEMITNINTNTESSDTEMTIDHRESNDKNTLIAISVESFEKIVCNKCGLGFDNKELLETHMITHRDPCTAYQCLECGECFVGKPSFSTHLILEHGIDNVQEYIDKKNCFNELALDKNQKKTEELMEPVETNQCVICREKFPDHETLEKHFRVHGMAFLLKNKLTEKT